MPATATAGRIDTFDIEEQIQAAQPWKVILRQMSPGGFHGQMDYVLLNGIIIYRERLSHRIIATAETPPGYFMFGSASVARLGIDWCSAQLNSQRFAYAPPSTEIDFITPDHSDHWVVLVPKERLLRHLDEASQVTLSSIDRYHLECHPQLGEALISTILHLVEIGQENSAWLRDPWVCKAIETQLLDLLTRVIQPADPQTTWRPPRRSRVTFSRAIEYAETLNRPITVPEFATAAGVSRRVLELAFQQTLSTTPLQYLRLRRLNIIHRELLMAEPETSSVTAIATDWGFSELGRFAVEYKRLFGESPSTTLKATGRSAPTRLADSLLNQSFQ